MSPVSSRTHVVALAVLFTVSCGRCGTGNVPFDAGSDAGSDAGVDASADASDTATDAATLTEAEPLDAAPPPKPPITCPPGMVNVKNDFCIDRWEASLVDRDTGVVLSPYYPPDRKIASFIASSWEKQRFEMGSEEAQQIPLPPLPDYQRKRDVKPKAVSRPNVVPNGYLSGDMAKLACENAGKRLCQHDEWKTACRGAQERQFPYGDKYEQGGCNIFRAAHPALTLHDNPSIGHTDPRLNLVKDGDAPLLRRTGATPRCKSEWGKDAAWDMNGNLDEWVEDPKGLFVGGFYSRSKRDGCDSAVRAHKNEYFDYSTGVRCCYSPAPPSPSDAPTTPAPTESDGG
jgi:hypothetical protein